MEPPKQFMPLTKEEFWKDYWFSPLQMVTVVNPKPYDFPFMVELRNFVIKKGETAKIPGTVANVYLSQMTRIMAQDDDKMNLLSDFAFMKLYYDKLIQGVENLIKEESKVPAYMKDVPAHLLSDDTPETPPWQTENKSVESSIPGTNSDMTNTLEDKSVKPTTKEFELNGAKYKMVVDKNDKEMYYKNGHLTSAGEYQKAASMI